MFVGTLVAHNALLISSPICAAAPHLFVAASTVTRNRIRRSLSKGFTAAVRYVSVPVLSLAEPRPMVTIRFLWLTVCHTWVLGPVIPKAAIVAIQGSGLVGS